MLPELPEILSIYVITYNRAAKLVQTLKDVIESPLGTCNITVFDNCSTDETQAEFQRNFSTRDNVRCIRNTVNIGAAANTILPLINSTTEYTWVLCDDDYLDFTSIADVVTQLQTKTLDLILVGGHSEDLRLGAGLSGTPRELMRAGVNYYRDTSFLPSTIYRTSFARRYIATCYSYCHFMYPQMALAFGAVSTGARTYVSQHRLVTASIGTQSYSAYQQLGWWFGLSETISDTNDRKSVLVSQWAGPLDPTGLYGLLNTAVRLRRFEIALRLIFIFNWRVLRAVWTMLRARARGVRYEK
jgi:glycosyltransferase involved in cell wall biosynthesis